MAALAVAALPLCGTRLAAQRCERIESRTNLAAVAGERVLSVDVSTENPAEHGIVGAVTGLVHVRTRAGAVRQRLLIAPGDVADTARVAESLRRLRRLRFLDDASIVAERCEGTDGVALTVATRDAWSISPELRAAAPPPPGAEELEPSRGLRLPNGLLGVEERNFLGSGREVRAGIETRSGRVGGSVSLVDPFVLGSPIVGRVRLSRLPNERLSSLTLRSDERDVARPWRGSFTATSASRWPMFGAAGHFSRGGVQGLVGRRVTDDAAGAALYVSAGAELASARMTRFDGMRTPGPETVARRFVGADVGVDRVATRYAPTTWLLPHDAVFDVPMGFEYSAVVGVGEKLLLRAPAAHLDAWVGRIWHPGDRALLATDVWSSGFLYSRQVEAGVLRTAATLLAAAPHGNWMVRVAGERLLRTDPDVRPLVGLDPTAPMLSTGDRLAGRAVAATLERSFRFDAPVGGRTAFDVAAFASGSLRNQPCGTETQSISAAVVGIGVHTAPIAATRATMRLDWMVPVAASPGLRRRPYARITVAPGFVADRVRDALRGR
ncbi:hypothetical protein J421_3030 [Gemmatirosa kalamazoonensis]|uniref:Uncharacterized protein n=1 Tax=Gemmatirosa kalamazoonensis TaxID=861299 RepID=W0RJF8_9BACT|nr:hypothetical protein [Gemmatirosa kalamazoonensis]AHG90567.1 hypothetical protein J421_3030 [Gemmatirosa kalamazoonensis]